MKPEPLKSGELFTWSGSAKVIFENAVFVLPPPAAVTCGFKRACTHSLSCVDVWTALISENTGLTCSASMTLLAEFPWPRPSFAGQEDVCVAWLTPDAVCHLTIRMTCAFICVPRSLCASSLQPARRCVMFERCWCLTSSFSVNRADGLKCNASTVYNPSYTRLNIILCVFHCVFHWSVFHTLIIPYPQIMESKSDISRWFQVFGC